MAKGRLAIPSPSNPVEDAKHLLKLIVQEMIRRMEDNPELVTAAEFAQMRAILSDNSITLAQVRAGDFGQLAQVVADEEFPFDVEGQA